MIKCEKIFPSIYTETHGMQCLDYPLLSPRCLTHQKSPQKKNIDHNFLYPSNKQHKNVPVRIVDPLVNAISMEISLIFYCLFHIFRPSRKPFADVTFVNLQ